MSVNLKLNNFVDFVASETEGFSVIGEYVSESKEIGIYHDFCGRSFKVRPKYFRDIKMCIRCVAKKNPTQGEYIDRVNILGNGEYEVLDDYVNEAVKLRKRHKVCGYIWNVAPNHFKTGKRCPKCSGRVRKDTEYFRKEVFEIVGDEYEVRSKYKGAKEKVTFFHNSEVCGGNVFKITPNDFLRGRGCTACADIARSGENHWKWNPNLTEEDRQRRDIQNGEIRKWRDQVYDRDAHTCQLCGEYGGKLNAHHLNSWDNHPDDRFELSNGITLCEECHRGFHVAYGYGSNTTEQFIEHATI